MERLLFIFFLLFATVAGAQKVDVVTYEQLTNPEKAKFMGKKIEFEAVQMPDGSVLRVGDVLTIAERSGDLKRKYKGVFEDVYSTIKYGGSYRPGIIGEPRTDDDAPDYAFAVDKGKEVVIHRFKPQKKLDQTFYVEIIIKPANGFEFTEGWNRARASLESFEKGELVKK